MATRLVLRFPTGRRRQRRLLVATAGSLVVAYVGLYAILSACGGRYWSQTGKVRYTAGLSVSDVERWFPAGLYWEPFRNVAGTDGSRGDPQGYFFSPLIRLDRQWVHRDVDVFATTRPEAR